MEAARWIFRLGEFWVELQAENSGLFLFFCERVRDDGGRVFAEVAGEVGTRGARGRW